MNFPHDYEAVAQASDSSLVSLSVEGLPTIDSAPPKQFGGTGDNWSPEDLLVASVADCFVLSFKAIAAASKFEWVKLSCVANGTLDKVDRAIQFTGFHLVATLVIAADADRSRAERLLEKSKQACFITSSLKAEATLEIVIFQA